MNWKLITKVVATLLLLIAQGLPEAKAASKAAKELGVKLEKVLDVLRKFL